MNREILFRGKRKDNKEWVYGTPIVMHHNDGRTHLHHFIIPDGVDLSFGVKVEDILVEIIPETRGQDTGLRDQNGRKIFKGDILKLVDKNQNYEWLAVVEFGNPNATYSWGWQLRPITKQVRMSRDILLWIEITGTTVEIIGNIYDNPELLEVE